MFAKKSRLESLYLNCALFWHILLLYMRVPLYRKIGFCPFGCFLLSKGRKNTKKCPFSRKVIQKVETFMKSIVYEKKFVSLHRDTTLCKYPLQFIDIVIFYSASRCCHYMPSRVEVH